MLLDNGPGSDLLHSETAGTSRPCVSGVLHLLLSSGENDFPKQVQPEIQGIINIKEMENANKGPEKFSVVYERK